jgi:hypothetical protein
MLRDAGFGDVREKVYKTPMGEWPEDQRLREVPDEESLGWIICHLLGPLYEVWLVDDVRKAIKDKETHSYDYMYFVHGRKKPAV